MAKRTGPTNPELSNLIKELRTLSSKEKVKVWKRIADDLSYATRRRREVNLEKIERHADEKMTIIVPGKVLGEGNIEKNVKVAAWKFSSSAKEKLGKNAISLRMLMKENPKGKNVRILG